MITLLPRQLLLHRLIIIGVLFFVFFGFRPLGVAQNPVQEFKNGGLPHFFTGDTLSDFDWKWAEEFVIGKTKLSNLSPKEKFLVWRTIEQDFVRMKYKLPKPTEKTIPIEKISLATDPCNNLGFETGDYTGWTGGAGENTNSNIPLTIKAAGIAGNSNPTNSPVETCGFFTLVNSGAAVDPYGPITPLFSGGGTYSVRLGGDAQNGNGLDGFDGSATYGCSPSWLAGSNSPGEMLTQTFLVTSSNAEFTYSFAAVLNDGAHPLGQQSYFKVEVLDSKGDTIPCLQFYRACTANGGAPAGFTKSTSSSGDPNFSGAVYYIGWTTKSLNLSSYKGQNVTVRFTAAGCTHGAHFGYAYIDASCGPAQLTIPPLSCSSTTATIQAMSDGVSYSWSQIPSGSGIILGGNSQNVTVNQSGTYRVTVQTGAAGCSYTMDTTISIGSSSMKAALTNTPVTCSGKATGTATATPSGATGPYTYNWSNGGTAQTISNLAAGTYSVTVTTSGGCSATSSVTITAPNALSVTPTPTQASCGKPNGSVALSVAGGTTNYTYSWSNGASTQTAANLVAGGYTVTVTDKNGCTLTNSATVGSAASFSVLAPGSANVKCNGLSTGTATANVSGGTGPFTYSWSSGATAQTAAGLAANTYTVTITDANGCTNTTAATITQPTVISLSAIPASASCGKPNGSMALSVAGGTGSYTYNWSNGNSTQNLSNVVAGSYSVLVTDGNGCTKTTNAIISTAASFSLPTPVPVNNNCNGTKLGSIPVLVSGGTGPFTYSWSNGASGQTVTNVAAGAYTVTVTDGAGCSQTTNATVTQPAAITLTTNTSVASCNKANGSASASASGGVGNFTYSWSTGTTGTALANVAAAVYSVTVTDGNGCTATATPSVGSAGGYTIQQPTVTNNLCFGGNSGSGTVSVSGGTGPFTYSWSNGTSGPTASGLATGSYTVTVTDGNGCQSPTVVAVTSPTALTAAVSPTNTTCGGNNGAASIIASGGNGTYTYKWSTGATSATVAALAAGNYTLTVTDANGCNAVAPYVIGASSSPVVMATVASPVLCKGNTGSVLATVTGGTSNYTYSWSSGQTAASSSTTNTLTSGAATYTVSVTDANACVSTSTVALTEPAAVSITSVSPTASSCGLANGLIAAVGTGGTGTLTYSWTGGLNGNSLNNLTAGNYTLTVSDANNCTATSATVVTNNSNLLAAAGPTSTFCIGDSIQLVSSGGATYAWLPATGLNNAAIANPIAKPTASTTYTVTVSNGATCSGTSTVAITVNQLPANPTVSAFQNIIQGQSVQLTATGGAHYTWTPTNGVDDPSSASPNMSPFTTTIYTVVIATAQGCAVSDTVTVFVTPDVCNGKNIFIPNAFSPNNDGENDRIGVRGHCINNLSFQIFDRWGECVYETVDLNGMWDGTFRGQPVNEGVYVYKAYIVFTNGTDVMKTGNITLVR